MKNLARPGRKIMIALVVCAALGAPARAMASCPCLSPSITAVSFVVTTQLALFTETIQRAFAATAGSLSLEIQGASKIATATRKEQSKDNLFAQQQATYHEVLAESLTAMDRSCQTANAMALTKPIASFASSVKRSLGGGLVEGVLTNRLHTRQRLAIGFLNTLCKAGMLSPGVAAKNIPVTYGEKWFVDNNCNQDDDYAYEFVKPFLHKAVLVPPPKDGDPNNDALTILLNPDNPANARTAADVWNGLTVRQKDFMAAYFFCRVIGISHERPLTLTADMVSTPAGMDIAMANLSAVSQVATVADRCFEAIEYRVAPNTDDADGGETSNDMQEVDRNAPFLTNALVNESGINPRDLRDYATTADMIANTPILKGGTPKVYLSKYVIDLAKREKCASTQNRIAEQKVFGSDTGKIENDQQCVKTGLLFAKKEAMERRAFVEMVAGFGMMDSSPLRSVDAPVRQIRLDDDGGGDRRRDAAGDRADIAPVDALKSSALLQPMQDYGRVLDGFYAAGIRKAGYEE